MKRNKIKNKYLKIINIDNNIQEIKKDTKVILNILKSISLIFLLLLWNSIPIIVMYFFGINYKSFSQLEKIFYLLTCDVLFIIFLIVIYRKDIKKNFKNFFNKNIFSNLELSFRYWGIGLAVMIASNFIINIINPGSTSANEEAIRNLIDLAPWYMAFELAIYAPLTEELIFRKSFKDITKHKYRYILLSGIIFGGMHVISSISAPFDLLYLIPYSALGIAFAALYYKTDNIFSTITIHSFHNLLSFALYLIGNNLI